MAKRKVDYRPDLARLTTEMKRRLGTRLQKDVTRETGLLTHQVSRVLNNQAQAPNFVETLRVGLAVGMTPTQMAQLVPAIFRDFEDLVFAEDDPHRVQLPPADRDLLALFNDERVSPLLRDNWVTLIRGLHAQAVLWHQQYGTGAVPPPPPLPAASPASPATPTTETTQTPHVPPRAAQPDAVGAGTAGVAVLVATRG